MWVNIFSKIFFFLYIKSFKKIIEDLKQCNNNVFMENYMPSIEQRAEYEKYNCIF